MGEDLIYRLYRLEERLLKLEKVLIGKRDPESEGPKHSWIFLPNTQLAICRKCGLVKYRVHYDWFYTYVGEPNSVNKIYRACQGHFPPDWSMTESLELCRHLWHRGCGR